MVPGSPADPWVTGLAGGPLFGDARLYNQIPKEKRISIRAMVAGGYYPGQLEPCNFEPSVDWKRNEKRKRERNL